MSIKKDKKLEVINKFKKNEKDTGSVMSSSYFK